MSNNMLDVTLRESRGPLKTLLDRMSGEDGQYWLTALNKFNRSEDPFKEDLSTYPPKDTADQLVLWQGLFDKIGIDHNVFADQAPTRYPWFDQLIVVPSDLTTLEEVVGIANDMFGVFINEDVEDKGGIQGVCDMPTISREGYMVWVHGSREPDNMFREYSANQVSKRGIQSITLLERILFELLYFSETGNHLDHESATLCAGSRYANDTVPIVYKTEVGKTGISINWCTADVGFTDHAIREVIT